MTQSQLIARYFSDSDNDIDMEIKPSIDNETIKRNRRKWIPLYAYNDKNDVIKKIKDDGIWSKTHTNITNEGKSIYYRCNQVKLTWPRQTRSSKKTRLYALFFA